MPGVDVGARVEAPERRARAGFAAQQGQIDGHAAAAGTLGKMARHRPRHVEVGLHSVLAGSAGQQLRGSWLAGPWRIDGATEAQATGSTTSGGEIALRGGIRMYPSHDRRPASAPAGSIDVGTAGRERTGMRMRCPAAPLVSFTWKWPLGPIGDSYPRRPLI